MIIFHRTENKDPHAWRDGVTLTVDDDYQGSLDETIRYFVAFMVALEWDRKTVIGAMQEMVEEEDGGS